MRLPPQQALRCLTAEQASNIADTFSPRFGGINTSCKRTQYEKSEQKLTWLLQCNGQINMDTVAGFDFPVRYATRPRSQLRAGSEINKLWTRKRGLQVNTWVPAPNNGSTKSLQLHVPALLPRAIGHALRL